MPEIRYCRTADGANLAYTIRGKGPPIIFVPSFISIAHGLGEAFEPLAEQLSRSSTVVAYDGRGMGLSDRNQVDYSLEARLADLQAIVDQMDAARVSIVARLYGVPTAIQFTASSPDRVDRLLLFGGYADGKRYYEESEFGQLADALRNVTDQQWQFVSQTMVARGAIPGTPADILDKRAAAMREDWTPHSLLAFREGNRAINVTDSLPLIQTPTMVVTISGGGSSILNYAREMASAIPRARLIQSKASWNAIDDETLHQSLEFLGVSDAVAPRSVQEPPSFRTILFTDLVGHTEMMSRPRRRTRP